MSTTELHYTEPVVCNTDPKDWYVYFEYFYNDEWHKRKVRAGINRIAEKRERYREAEALAAARLVWLKAGWNPIIDPKFLDRQAQAAAPVENDIKKKQVPAALDFALGEIKLKVAPKTHSGYKSNLKYIKKAITLLNLGTLPISELKKFHVKTIMSSVTKDRSLSNHGHNKYLDTFRRLLTELEEWEAIEYNPAAKLTHLQVAESDKFESWTNVEKERVRKFLYLHHYRFYVYLQVLYHTGIRPKEILALKIGDTDLSAQNIRIVPDAEADNSKVKNIRDIPINNHLLPFLREMNLQDYPSDWYIFGSPFAAGMGNRGAGSQKWPVGGKPENAKTGIQGAMRENYLLPSPNRVKRDTVTKLFKALIMDKLGISKYMYALKHTGADDKILAGISLDALVKLYGHSSKYMTEKYAKKIREIYKADLIGKSPAFSIPESGISTIV